MKIPHLHNIDLARIAPLGLAQKWNQLRQIRQGFPPLTYAPLRESFHDIFNVQTPLLGFAGPTDLAKIEEKIKKKAKTDDEFEFNWQVAKGLRQFAGKNEIVAHKKEFSPLAIGMGKKVEYWLSFVLNFDSQAFVPFIDPRKTKRLTNNGRRFVFSMMDQRIRLVDPDFSNVRFGIFQFGEVSQGVRPPILYTDEGVPLYTFEELEEMVASTYQMWAEICAEREKDSRKKADGMSGPLI